mmetsp:Transcript_48717/g.155725  ORF Transcript_48717/g.155725 Transcript_48717/m.155725 type:complete len:336 (+) Transcript_48717:116-1123(+)
MDCNANGGVGCKPATATLSSGQKLHIRSNTWFVVVTIEEHHKVNLQAGAKLGSGIKLDGFEENKPIPEKALTGFDQIFADCRASQSCWACCADELLWESLHQQKRHYYIDVAAACLEDASAGARYGCLLAFADDDAYAKLAYPTFQTLIGKVPKERLFYLIEDGGVSTVVRCDSGTLRQCHPSLIGAKLKDMAKQHAPTTTEPDHAKVQFILASAPEALLPDLISKTKAHEGWYCAGDKSDGFNAKILANAGFATSWRTGWLGKIKQTIDMATQLHPHETVHVIAIPGGDACNWERQQLEANVIPTVREHGKRVEYKCCGDIEGFDLWLEKTNTS